MASMPEMLSVSRNGQARGGTSSALTSSSSALRCDGVLSVPQRVERGLQEKRNGAHARGVVLAPGALLGAKIVVCVGVEVERVRDAYERRYTELGEASFYFSQNHPPHSRDQRPKKSSRAQSRAGYTRFRD